MRFIGLKADFIESRCSIGRGFLSVKKLVRPGEGAAGSGARVLVGDAKLPCLLPVGENVLAAGLGLNSIAWALNRSAAEDGVGMLPWRVAESLLATDSVDDWFRCNSRGSGEGSAGVGLSLYCGWESNLWPRLPGASRGEAAA